MCVIVDHIPPWAGLLDQGAENCPVPCNPTWTYEELEEVCGPNRRCCQTVELAGSDCVLDEETGCHRPARGQDIIELGDPWDADAHETHQDPGLHACAEIAEGGGQAALEDCYRQLSVADQRGYCMSLHPEAVCPAEKPSYLSACDELNLQAGLDHCVE
jgi:hypothetical protein